MSEARALTNLIGNSVATVVVAKLDKDLDVEHMRRDPAQETVLEAKEPEKEIG
jgi:aerobic C4-dicarboxylate transport protein